MGLGRGDVVALIVSDAEQFLTVLCGATMAGVIPASLYPPSVTSQPQAYAAATARALQFAGARALVTTESLISTFEKSGKSCSELSWVVSAERLTARATGESAGLRAIPDVTLDDIAFVQFTSGSTSAPKGITITHRNLSSNIDAVNGPDGLGSSSHDIAVSWLPLYHDMGLVGMALGPMYCGRPAVLLQPEAFIKRPAEWLRAISRHRGTVSFAPNFAYDLCVRRVKPRDIEDTDLSSWRVAGCGGEPIRAGTLEAFAEKFGSIGFRSTSFVPSYGLAEHVVAVTLSPCDRPPRVDRLHPNPLTHRSEVRQADEGHADHVAVVSCGRPLAGHAIRVLDENGREVPERVVGEITLGGPSVMKGYFANEELTARTVRDGWLHTGDLGYLADRELFVCGRVKDVIISNGLKYYPQDLEWAVADLPGIRHGRVVAFAATNHGADDRVVIVIESAGTVPAELLTERIRRRVGDACGLHVDDVVVAGGGAIQKTTSGKVRRWAIKARYERGELASVSRSPAVFDDAV
jgi:fatty-acyl-CoA synthase